MQDIELLEKVWGTVAEWHQLYSGWKDGSFGDLKVEEMEEAAGRVAKALQRLGREIKHWPAWAWIKVIFLLCQQHPSTCRRHLRAQVTWHVLLCNSHSTNLRQSAIASWVLATRRQSQTLYVWCSLSFGSAFACAVVWPALSSTATSLHSQLCA